MAGPGVQAFDGETYSTERVYFGVGVGDTEGYGVYTSDSCSAITQIIIEPDDWGAGNYSIKQDPCTSVPEPAPLGLFGLGLLTMAVTRRLQMAKSS